MAPNEKDKSGNTSRPTPGQAEGSREDVEAALNDRKQGDDLDRSPNRKGNVTVGRNPDQAEGERKEK